MAVFQKGVYDLGFLSAFLALAVASALRSGLLFKPGDFLRWKDTMVVCRPFQKRGFFGVNLNRAGAERVFRYRGLRELAKRLFCWNCDLASSSDKLCGRGLRWPKSGAWGAGFGWHFSGCGLTVFMKEI